MLSTDKQTDKQTDRQTDKLTNATKNITSFAKEVNIMEFNDTWNVSEGDWCVSCDIFRSWCIIYNWIATKFHINFPVSVLIKMTYSYTSIICKRSRWRRLCHNWLKHSINCAVWFLQTHSMLKSWHTVLSRASHGSVSRIIHFIT